MIAMEGVNKWDSKWVWVTDIHATNGLTVLLSSEKDASISLRGSADLSVGNLAKISAAVSVISKSKQIEDYIVQGQATPLLKARRVTKKGIVTMKAIDDGPAMVLSDGDLIDLGGDEELAEVTFDYCDLDADKLAD
jgi:hypothetical protein